MNLFASSVSALCLSACIPLAHADVDLSGSWAQKVHHDLTDRLVGPAIGDLTGLPINDAARLRAESWDDAAWSVPEHQCETPPADSAPQGPASMRVWAEPDPKTQQVVAWHMVYLYQNPHRVIWMDGRQHPSPGALHSYMGFSTGKWVGDTLVVTTTHLKAGWIRRNGVPRSDLANLTEFWTRHGNYLTLTSVVEDPVYLTAPYIRSSNWLLDPGYDVGPYSSCYPKTENDLPRGFVAHHLPGTNSAFREYPAAQNLPPAAANGGEETIYPEYAAKLTDKTPSVSKVDTGAKAPRKDRSDRKDTRDRSGKVRNRSIVSTEPPGVEVLQIRDNIYALMSPNGNTTVQVGNDGVLIVDTQRPELSQAILDEVRKLSVKPIRNIINTSADWDKTGGNERIAKEGRTLGPTETLLGPEEKGASIYAHENVLRTMSSAGTGKSARAPGAWPTDVYFTDTTEIYFNSEAVQINHPAAAHSDGDSLVYFRRSDVLSAGDVFSMTSYPNIDLTRGGSINGVIEALNRLIDIAVPARNEEGGTVVIPGRGRLGDEYDLVYYRDMVTIIRDRIQDLIHKGLTLEQIRTARPTADYDGRFGAAQGQWTTQQFVESVYRSLTAAGGGT